MVPTTWLAVLFFVLLVAPGLLYDLLADGRRAKSGESVFREVSRTVLASLIISTLSISILVAIRWARPAWMPDPDRLFSGMGGYAARHYRLILRTSLLEGGIALVIAAGFHWILARRLRAPVPGLDVDEGVPRRAPAKVAASCAGPDSERHDLHRAGWSLHRRS